MTEKELEAIFTMAGISIIKKWELMNQYWPRPEVQTLKEYKEDYLKNYKILESDDRIEHGWKSEYMSAASYWKLVIFNPWWLVKTNIGLITIGPRKRVINIDWEDTNIRKIISSDDVTKSETMIHAWTLEKCVEYLKALKVANKEYDRETLKTL